jgi:predicted nucleic acid-binding protein
VVLVDTNVLVYLLIQGDRTRLAQALYARDPEWKSEGFALLEMSNVLATFQRSGALDPAQARRLLDEAERLLRGQVNVPHATALEVAGRHGVSAYDARFLAAAERLGVRLVTEDAKLRSAAPALTESLDEALAGRR